MIKKIFILYSVLISILLGYASETGWKLTDVLSSSSWGPGGRSGYHK